MHQCNGGLRVLSNSRPLAQHLTPHPSDKQVRPECVAGMACLLGMTQGYVQPTHLQHAAPRAHPPAPAGGCTISSSKLEGQPCAALDATSSSPDARESSSNSSSKPGLLPSSGVVLMRQLESYRLFPSAQQLHLIDKRFGGGALDLCGCFSMLLLRQTRGSLLG
jgi:hypothetical protein